MINDALIVHADEVDRLNPTLEVTRKLGGAEPASIHDAHVFFPEIVRREVLRPRFPVTEIFNNPEQPEFVLSPEQTL
jgi:hypothetical protein